MEDRGVSRDANANLVLKSIFKNNKTKIEHSNAYLPKLTTPKVLVTNQWIFATFG